MRALLVIALVIPLLAQPPAKPPDQSPATPQAPAQTEAPALEASGEAWLTGYIEVGDRIRTDVGGSLSTYRSIVNLGSGPKLLDTDFTLSDPKRRLFDRINVRAFDWGDDPYSTFHLDARKEGVYRFNADYRSLAYFNNLPSFADPLLSRGILLNEQSFDTRRRLGSFELEFRLAKRIVPYLAYDRDRDSGTGVMTFATSGNEFPVPDQTRDLTNNFRGGVRVEFPRFHITLEQGGTTFREDQSQYYLPGGRNYGNLGTAFGQQLYLTSLQQAWGVRGSSIYTQGLATAHAAFWLDLSGQFVFSQPRTEVNYQQYDNGNLALLSQALLFNSESYLVSSTAKMPHTTGLLGADIRPFSRLRILESWLTDRLHNAGSSNGQDTMRLALATASPQAIASLLSSTLTSNYNQQETDVLFDMTSRLTLRGGYRRVWGDASDIVLPVAGGLYSNGRAELRRNVAIGGVTFRTATKLSIHGEVEGALSDGAYFRTSLYDYRRVRAQARYQLAPSLNLSADFSYLDNYNPAAGTHYEFRGMREAASVQWLPNYGKRWGFDATYERSAFHSDITYLAPQLLSPAQSIYRENAHTITALIDTNLPAVAGHAAKISAGGSAFFSSGNRPTTYYQPVVRAALPFGSHVAWFGEWRYYGFGEAFYLYESFRTHLVTTGLRFSR